MRRGESESRRAPGEVAPAFWQKRRWLPVEWLLRGLGWLYGAGARMHAFVYARGPLRARRLPCRVVSVGGLSVGGSGKTPVAAAVADLLHRQGLRVVLASRGHGREQSRTLSVVSDGRRVLSPVALSGDEPPVLARHASGVPVIVHRDRGIAGLRAVSTFAAEALVLDDGHQHHRLARDLNMLCLTGVQGLGNGRTLPAGPLREPLPALGRADAFVVVDGPLDVETNALLVRHAPGARRFEARREPLRLSVNGQARVVPLAQLEGMKVGVLAALAEPEAFRSSVSALGAEVVASRFFRDHHRYTPEDLLGLSALAPTWITTEKDAVKLPRAWLGRLELWVLESRVRFEDEMDVAAWLGQRLGLDAGGKSDGTRPSAEGAS